MKVLMINVCSGIKSTGRICTDLASALIKNGHEVKIAYGRGFVPTEYQSISKRITSTINVYKQAVLSRIFDSEALMGNETNTKEFINWIKVYKPDIIHLHNIHGYYINCELLFSFLKDYKKPVIWTLHDCWSFTGHCAYFDYINCSKWLTGCKHCPQKKSYPSSYIFNRSYENYKRKKTLFTQLEKLTIVTPSKWLAKYVVQSFLQNYQICVIPNGINIDIFKPCINNVKEKLGITNKILILGVAASWGQRKGLNTFLELSKKLDDRYVIVLIGLTRNQIKSLPNGIIGIESTNDVHELAEYYSAADYFVNPTLEDNYPTTNLEAIACGTPVITFDTGGSVESAAMYGFITKNKSADAIYNIIENRMIPDKKIDRNLLSIDTFIKRYLELYTN